MTVNLGLSETSSGNSSSAAFISDSAESFDSGYQPHLTAENVQKHLADTIYNLACEILQTEHTYGNALESVHHASQALLLPFNKTSTDKTVEALNLEQLKTRNVQSSATFSALIDAPVPSKEEASFRAERYRCFETAAKLENATLEKVKEAVEPLFYCDDPKIQGWPSLTIPFMQATLEGNITYHNTPIAAGSNAIIYTVQIGKTTYARKEIIEPFATSKKEVSIAMALGDPFLPPLVATEKSIIYPLGQEDLNTFIQRIRSNPTTENALLLKNHLLETAKGLSILQQSRCLHRDIKPHNILIVDGKAKIIDPDTTVQLQNYTRSQAPEFRGTAMYLSPEMAKTFYDRPENPDALLNTDVFAFGLCIFEALKKSRLESPYTSLFNKTGKIPETYKATIATRAKAKPLSENHLKGLLSKKLKQTLDPTKTLSRIMYSCFKKAEERPSFNEIVDLVAAI